METSSEGTGDFADTLYLLCRGGASPERARAGYACPTGEASGSDRWGECGRHERVEVLCFL